MATRLTAQAKTISRLKKDRHLRGLSEDDFRDHVIRPLFLRQGLADGRDLCGPSEHGKDAIFVAINPLGQQEIYAVQTKIGNLNLGKKASLNLADAATQLRTAVETNVVLLNPHRKERPTKGILCASGKINDAARRYILDEVRDPRLMFLDCDDLIPLVDEHYPEFWFGIDAELAPYFSAIKQRMEGADDDLRSALAGVGGPQGSAVTDESFVPIRINRTRWRPSRRYGRTEREPHVQEFPIQALLDRRETLTLISGGAGTGKSTCLRRLAYVAAERGAASTTAVTIPVLLKAANLPSPSGETLVQQCAAETIRLSGSRHASFSPSDLEAGRVLVLIDALDEVAANEGRSVVLDLAVGFTSTYPRCRVIVASRPLSSIYGLPQISAFTEFEVSSIGIPDAAKIVRRLHTKGRLSKAQSGEVIRRLQQVHGMELSPLLVTLFVAISEHGRRDIPANITELFKKFTELMLGRWDVAKGLGQQYQAPLKDFILTRVAFEMHRRRIVELQVGEMESLIAQELGRRGHEAVAHDLCDEIINRSSLFRRVDDNVEFRHHLLQEFFAGRGIPSVDFLESVISDDWWRRAIVFYFGENPSDGKSLEVSRQAVLARPIQERYKAALAIGLAMQACYLVEVDSRIGTLQWVLETLAVSRGPFLKDMKRGGRQKLMALLWYYLAGRDAVGSQILRMSRGEVWRAIGESELSDSEKEAARFWVIVGLIEAGHIEEAEEMIAAFETEDASLMLAIHLGCFQLSELRATAADDREVANRIMQKLAPRIEGARGELLREFETELVEIRKGRVERIAASAGSGREGEEMAE